MHDSQHTEQLLMYLSILRTSLWKQMEKDVFIEKKLYC